MNNKGCPLCNKPPVITHFNGKDYASCKCIGAPVPIEKWNKRPREEEILKALKKAWKALSIAGKYMPAISAMRVIKKYEVEK